MMFTSFRKDQKRSEDDSSRRALIETIVIKVIPLFFAVVLVYIFLVYGALIALMAMFVSVEQRRYYPYHKG